MKFATARLWLVILLCLAIASSSCGISGSSPGSGPIEPQLKSLIVAPANASIPIGQTQQFTATGELTDGSTQDLTSAAVWNSSSPSVIRIGAQGLAVSVDTGTSRIGVTADGITSGVLASVSPAVLESDLHNPLPERYVWSEDSTTPGSTRYFRASFSVQQIPSRATVYVAGPNRVTVYLNGEMVASGQAAAGALTLPLVVAADVSAKLQIGRNVLAIACADGDEVAAKVVPDAPGANAPALLITDPTWKVTETAEAGWEQPAHDDTQWETVKTNGSVESGVERFKGGRDSAMYQWPGYDGISNFLARYSRPAEAILNVAEGSGGFSNTEALTQRYPSAEFSVRIPPSVPPQASYPSLVLDFGREVSGRLEVASDTAEPVNLAIRYGESLQEALVQPFYGENELVVPVGAVTHGPKGGFRYAQVKFVSGPPVASFKTLGVEEIYYAIGYRGFFDSSDPLLNRIWRTGARTAQLTMQEGVWDGIKRDRLNWMGDLYVSGKVIQSVFMDQFVAPNTMSFLASNSLGPTGQVNNIPGYSAFWVMGLADYYRHTGDVQFVSSQQEPLRNILRNMESSVDGNGMFAFTASDFPFVDWSPDLFTDTAEARKATQFAFYKAFQDGAWLLDQLQDPEQASTARIWADTLRTAAQTRLLDSDSTYGTRWQTNAMAVFSGITDAAENDAIWQTVLSRPSESAVTPYYNYFVTAAMAQTGHRQQALDWIRAYWGGMLAEGATSFWEAYDLSWPKDNFHAFLQADRTEGYYVSLCHGWSGGPTAWLMEQVLGIQPVTPGFSEVAIRPDLIDLQWAQGIQPTPNGDISVQYRRDNGLTGLVSLPSQVRASLSLPILPGQVSVLINGNPTPGAVAESGARLTVILDGAGLYNFRTSALQ